MERVRIRRQKRGRIPFLLCFFFLLAGCSSGTKAPEKLKDLEFTVVAPDNIPQELKDIIEEKKKEPFKITYEDEGWLYVAAGYGEQKNGGYSISVRDFYETDNAIYVDTNLLGPGDIEEKEDQHSYPYIVLKTEKIGKNVVFR